jgi:cytochrome P450
MINLTRKASRLYPAAPYGTRVALVDTMLPSGGGKDGKSPILIKAGTSVWWAGYAMHRREAFWGKDALEFKPERWESLGDPGSVLFPHAHLDY